eukprot:UN11451
MILHQMKNSFGIQNIPVLYRISAWYPGMNIRTQYRSDLGALSIFGAQGWHSELLNGVLDVSVAHLEYLNLKFDDFKIGLIFTYKTKR